MVCLSGSIHGACLALSRPPPQRGISAADGSLGSSSNGDLGSRDCLPSGSVSSVTDTGAISREYQLQERQSHTTSSSYRGRSPARARGPFEEPVVACSDVQLGEPGFRVGTGRGVHDVDGVEGFCEGSGARGAPGSTLMCNVPTSLDCPDPDHCDPGRRGGVRSCKRRVWVFWTLNYR